MSDYWTRKFEWLEVESERLRKVVAEKEETIAGLETEIFRLQGIVSLMYHFHDVLLKNIEVNTYNMRNAMEKFIPRRVDDRPHQEVIPKPNH